jgi:hypothetical protein
MQTVPDIEIYGIGCFGYILGAGNKFAQWFWQ